VIGVAIFLLGAAYTHIYDLVAHNNRNPGNAGAILYMDIILPVVAIGLLVAYRLQQRGGWFS
jgi:hypothetical protein